MAGWRELTPFLVPTNPPFADSSRLIFVAADKGTIERFKNELKFARKIAHRNVCKMCDLNEEEETLYITMEYVKGEGLKSFIRRKGKLTEEEAIAIAKQVCEGLAEAHELGVIHRDLKPQNIMIDKKRNAKVIG